MDLSPEQDRAALDVSRWLASNDGPQVYRLFGGAGCGKTTIAKKLVESESGNVLFAAYTGKAAHVLTQKGCPAQTIHSLIYNSSSRSKELVRELEQMICELRNELQFEGMNDLDDHPKVLELEEKLRVARNEASKPSFRLNPDSILRYSDLLVIDECSMIGPDIGEDLMSFGVKILVLGDPYQLPPPKSGMEGFFTAQKPNFLLTEVHRQARDSPIIDVATRIRNRETLRLGQYGEDVLVTDQRLAPDFVMSHDQIIVGKNMTRHASIKRVRQIEGRDSQWPEPGEKLICLKNNKELGLLNGSIWYAGSTIEFDSDSDMISMEVTSEDGLLTQTVRCFASLFRGEEVSFWEAGNADHFFFGQAITCHKAQGSQWDSVLVFDESRVFRQYPEKWLYTAVTRAAKKLTISRN